MRRGVPGQDWVARIALGVCTGAAMAAGVAACSSSSPAGADDAGLDVATEPDLPDTAPPARDAATDTSEAADAADATKPPVEGGAPYCASLVPQPRFCDDFDDGDLTNDWTQTAFAPGSTNELDVTSFTSGPTSYHVKTPASAAAASGNALLRLTQIAAVAHPKLSFSAFLPAVTFTKGSVAIATLDVSLSHFFTLYLRDIDGAAPAATLKEYVGGGGGTTRHVLTKLPPVNAWSRITIDLDLTNGKANVSFDAQEALVDEPITAVVGSEATVRIGVIIDGPADAFEARFDDVVLTY